MSNYGRNFEFRVGPRSGERAGRYYFAGPDEIAIGAPVVVDLGGTENTLGQLPVVLAATSAARPANGMGGIVVFEYAPAAFSGDDANLVLASDKNKVPVANTHVGSWESAVQVVNGDTVKVVLRNTVDRLFLNVRNYTGETMIAGVGATPTVSVGDGLEPGTGDFTSGFWQAQAVTDLDTAWAVVTKVDATRDEVEARLLF